MSVHLLSPDPGPGFAQQSRSVTFQFLISSGKLRQDERCLTREVEKTNRSETAAVDVCVVGGSSDFLYFPRDKPSEQLSD